MMELWIRSQDRENTVKINRQYGLYWKDKTMIIADYQPDFVGTEGEYYQILGKYSTKERALEVLDEIQKLLQPIYKVTNEFKKSDLTGNCQWIENQEYIPIQTKVYEMPEE